jgi:hypothetical protein
MKTSAPKPASKAAEMVNDFMLSSCVSNATAMSDFQQCEYQ